MLEEKDIEAIGKILGSWAALASHFIGECFDYSRPFIEVNSDCWDPQVRFVSTQLYIDCHLTSESVLILINAIKEWDADLICRSVIEGTIKYVYMLTGRNEEKLIKAREYWCILPSFSSIKRSERLKRFFEVVSNPESSEWRAYRELILNDVEVESIRKGYTRVERQEMEERWSFAGITKQLSQSEDPVLRETTILAHGYGMSSHLLHKDGVGVSIVRDRMGRELEHEEAIKLAHAARIVSDICFFSELRLRYLLKIHGENTNFLNELRGKYSLLFEQTRNALKSFNKSEYETELP
jgi:hypothetical protein